MSGTILYISYDFTEALLQGYLQRMWQKIFVRNSVKNGGHFAVKRYVEVLCTCLSSNHVKTESSNFSALMLEINQTIIVIMFCWGVPFFIFPISKKADCFTPSVR